jgi:signal transduction histidine kinase
MPDLVWYRSLYWRIAFGFVALVATLLVLQGIVFLWLTGRMTDLLPTRSPAQFAEALAADVSEALVDNPALDVRAFVSEEYGGSFRSFVVVMRDGTVVESERVPASPNLARAARGRLFGPPPFGGRGGPPPPPGGRGTGPESFGRGVAPPDRPGAGRGAGDGGVDGGRAGGFRRTDRAGGPPFGEGRGGRRGGGPGQTDYAQILLDGEVAGIVAVPIEPPSLTAAVRDLGPLLGVVALGLLVTGTAVAAYAIFGPTRRRLSELQAAVRGVGAGDFSVRAPETGGDEVTSLSRAFNEMAGQLEERTEALAAADRTRRQLLADVSHELMTPLAAIRGYVETLGMSDLAIDDQTRGRYLGIVNDESERLEHIIGDLLELARLEGGGGGLREEAVSVSSLLERISNRHAPVVTEKHIALRVSQDPAVDSVRGDQNRLEQALQNLVANAVRHTPEGGTVWVTASAGTDAVNFVVEDTGPGVPADQLARVFDRFYKVDESRTGTAVPSGSGLGLSIVQAIVTRHGGTVEVSNRAEGGARFVIRLPLVPASET